MLLLMPLLDIEMLSETSLMDLSSHTSGSISFRQANLTFCSIEQKILLMKPISMYLGNCVTLSPQVVHFITAIARNNGIVLPYIIENGLRDNHLWSLSKQCH